MKTIGIYNESKEWLDYSSISLLKVCPRKFYWRVQQALVEDKESKALITGSAVHEGIHKYHEVLLAGIQSEEEARLSAYQAALNIMYTIKEPDDTHNGSHTVKVLENYFTRWLNTSTPCKHAELGFAVDVGDFVFVGKIDGIHDSQFGLLIRETKTTSIVGERWQLRTKPNNQIDGYVAAYAINTGEIPFGAILDVIPLTIEKRAGNKLKEPFRFITPRSDKDIDEWLSNLKEWYHILTIYKERNTWPMNTDACAPLVGFTCEYITLCQQHPSVVAADQIDIPELYKREVWKPWEIPDKKEEVNNEAR